MKPLVSVCCLAYNHAQYIRKALDGILRQKTSFPFEVVVHDDASTDGTVEIIKEYVAKYPGIIRPIFEKENQYSKNVSISIDILYPAAQGKYIALCECDDFWSDCNKLEKQISYMEKHLECSCTAHAVNYIENEVVTKNDRRAEKECDFLPEQVIAGGGAFVATCSLCFRTKYACEKPKFRVMAANVGDYPLQILLSLKGKFHYFPKIMGGYRFGRPGSWTEEQRNDISKSIANKKSEIKWLNELNKETNFKYRHCICRLIGGDINYLYKYNEISARKFKNLIDEFGFDIRNKIFWQTKIYLRKLKNIQSIRRGEGASK